MGSGMVVHPAPCRHESRAPVALTWEMGSYDGNGKYYENSFVLKNVSDAPIGKDWEIYYSQFPRSIRQDASSSVRVEEVNATLFKIYPGEGFLSLTEKCRRIHMHPKGVIGSVSRGR